MTSLLDEMEEWKVAQSRLFDAIDAFRGACVALEAAADRTQRALGDCSSAEAMITACLPNIRANSRRLYSAELVLCRTLNSSPSLVPISKLPPELLCSALWFAINSSPCIPDNVHPPKGGTLGIRVVIQLVCSRWRHLVVNSPSLWSHVDVLGSKPSGDKHAPVSKFTQIQLERVVGAPICLHFHASVREYPDFRVALFLRPYLRRTYSLVFLGYHRSCLIRTISEVCSSYSAPAFIHPRDAPCSGLPEAMHLDWPKRTFYGITDLRIRDTEPRQRGYYLDHLLAMLSSNPLIRVLRLGGIPPYLGSDTRSPTLISLPHLELLDVLGAKPDYKLLSKLKPGTVGLDLRLHGPRTEEEAIVLRSFSERSRVKSLTLKLASHVNLPYLHSCISSMPHLGALFLDDNSMAAALDVSDLVKSALLSPTFLTCQPMNTSGSAPHLFPTLKWSE